MSAEITFWVDVIVIFLPIFITMIIFKWVLTIYDDMFGETKSISKRKFKKMTIDEQYDEER